MLREEVWLLVHTTDRGMMHLECVEERLGRTLRRTDFATQERLNPMMCHLSPLLRSRYSPSSQELRRGAADFVALLGKHEDVLIRLLKRFHLYDAGRIHGWGVAFEVLLRILVRRHLDFCGMQSRDLPETQPNGSATI
jgi:hypothetical protein